MASEWKTLLRGQPDVRISGDEVCVQFAGGRQHVVTIAETEETYELSAIVTRSREAAASANDDLRLWRRHRSCALVGFRLDKHGRLIGEGWVPREGVTADELQIHVRTLAAECDRLEHALTGRDVE